MHVGTCLDAHKGVGIRPCNASSPLQQYVYDPMTNTGGLLSSYAEGQVKCLAVAVKKAV